MYVLTDDCHVFMEHTRGDVSRQETQAIIALVLGAGTDYAHFLAQCVPEGLRNGRQPLEVVNKAISTVGETIACSALTVIAASLSLVAAQFGIYHSLGPSPAIALLLVPLSDRLPPGGSRGLVLLPSRSSSGNRPLSEEFR